MKLKNAKLSVIVLAIIALFSVGITAPSSAVVTTWTLTYNGNGHTGGTAPVDPSSPYNDNHQVTVLTEGTLVKTGHTFAGWNTAANGSGTSYAPGAKFSIQADTVLYAQWTATTHTLTYNGNGNSGGTAPTDPSSPYSYGSTVTVLGKGTLVKTGYNFANWNTAANGSGTSYAPAATFTITGSVTLYAQWTLNSHTVTYNGNGNTGGTAPTDSSSPYADNATVTVLGNTGGLVKTGYTFSNWNTAANGSGTSYAPAATFTINGNVTLYAQWTINIYTVTYNGNGSDSGTTPTDSSSPYNYNSTVTVLDNTGGLAKNGHTFAGWNTAANGSGTAYAPASTFTISGNTILYAQWHIDGFKISYNGNGNTGGTAPTDPSSPYDYNTTVTVLGNTGGLTKTDHSFSGWNTAANGSGTTYAASDTFKITTDVTLYAQWVQITHTVTYNGNGNTGGSVPTDSSSPYLPNATVTVLDKGTLVNTGHTFTGWNTAANGSGTSYAPSATFVITSNVTLYAQWTLNSHTVTYDGNGNDGGTAPSDSSSPYNYNSTVTVLGKGSLTLTNYVFTGWNTAANGSGTSYATAETFAITNDVTLYAQWHVDSFAITYDGNDNTGGAAPTDPSSPYPYNNDVTVLGNSGGLVKTGYSFSGWNTAANGSGTDYSASDSFKITSDTTLYAKWVINTHTVTYDGNGNTGGAAPTDPANPHNYNSTVTVLGNTGGLVFTGYIFDGWNTAANGSGTSYAPAATFTITSNVTLYAQWHIDSFTLTYDGNDATGGSVPTDSSSPYTYTSTVTVLDNTGALVKTGYTFAGWNTAANGSGTSYSATNTFSITSDTTLYAQWTPETHTITYDGNGNLTGTTPSDSSNPYNYNSTVTVIGNSGGLDKGDDFAFNDWNTAANGSGTSYKAGDTFTITSDTILYAQWVQIQFDEDFDDILGMSTDFKVGADGKQPITGHVNIEPGSVPSGTFVFSIEQSPLSTDAFPVLEIVAKTTGGTPITSFLKPIEIILPFDPATDAIPVFSEGGVTWKVIRQITGASDLSTSGDDEGYRINGDGTITIFTNHTTAFGYRAAQASLTANSNSLSMYVGSVATLDSVGGSGTGSVTFNTTTPTICSIVGSTLTGLSAGTCSVTATKSSDANYVAITSSSLNINIVSLPAGGGGGGGGAAVVYMPQPPLTISAKETTVQLDKKTKLTLSGGAGTGYESYSTLTPEICSVSSDGVVTGLKVGTCSIRAAKAGSGVYSDATPTEITLTISDSEKKAASDAAAAAAAAEAQRQADALKNDFVITKSNGNYILKINLAETYKYQTIFLQLGAKNKSGKIIYKRVAVLSLNANGDSTFKQKTAFLKGTYFRVLIGKKVIFTKKVN